MRIIAGVAKGRRLTPPPGDGVRPTSDRVKEAWFSALAPLLPGAVVLDLYSGSGALGLEAASRGAASVVCVERDRRTARVLEENVRRSGLDVQVVVADALAALQGPLAGRTFDLVVADPPYLIDPAELAGVLAALVDRLAPGAEVWLESSRRTGPPAWPAPLSHGRTRRYGDTELHTAVLEGPEP